VIGWEVATCRMDGLVQYLTIPMSLISRSEALILNLRCFLCMAECLSLCLDVIFLPLWLS